MKIVCACLNSKFIHSSLAPWCLRAGIKAFSADVCEVQVIESTINSDIDKFVNEIISCSPEIVAFSCYIWNIEHTLKACKLIKNINSECNIVLGGPEVCYRTEDILSNYSFIDFIINGEGEWAFSSFVNCLINKDDLYMSEGLSYRKDGVIFSNPEKLHFDTPPSPYCDEYFKKLNGRIVYIESSRGCPFKCSYCLSGRVSPLRYFNINEIIENIILLSHSGTKTIKFIDRTFNANADKANEILAFIKDNYGKSINHSVCFHFEISADILKSETLDILKNMPEGAIQLEVGIQSFNNQTLNAINRHVNTAVLISNISKLISFGNIYVHTDLIAGLPYEDLESFVKGFNEAFYLRSHMLQLGFLKVLSGTEMMCKADKFDCKYSDMPPYEFITTKWINESDKKLLKECESALDKLYNSGRFHMTVDYLLETGNYTPFSLFCYIGGFINNKNISLVELAKLLYDIFSDKCNNVILREKICCDIFSTSANIALPDNLVIYEPLYKRNKKYYSEFFKEKVKIVILHSCNKVFIVKDSDKMNLYDRFEGSYYDVIT